MNENPLKLDSKPPKISFEQFANTENRFRMLQKTDPERAKKLMVEAQRSVTARFDVYKQLASLSYASEGSSETN